MAQVDNLRSKGYTALRKCRGDGNCYFRAVYFAYLETLIRKEPKYLRTFINMYFFVSNTL